MQLTPTALVPVRIGPVSKRRLASVATRAERTELVATLFAHVVGVLEGAGLDVIALSPQPVEEAGVEVWIDRAGSLNAAIDDAVRRLGTPALIVHADLPRIDVDDVEAICASTADVVIARARDGGTNALLLRRPMRVRFGRRSALAHAIRARKHGYATKVIDRPGLAVDVDDAATLTSSSSYRRRLP